MRTQFSSLTYDLWFTIMALHVLLCVLVTLRRTVVRLPFFAVHVYLCLVSNIACYTASQTASASAYLYMERSGGLLVYAILALFLWRDVYLRIFGPRISLPYWVPARVVLCTAILYVAVLVTAITLPDRWIVTSLVPLDVANRAALGIIAAISAVLILYSFRLGISWEPSTLAITAGLAFSSISDLAASYIRHTLSLAVGSILRNAGMVAYLVTLLVWVGAVLAEKIESETATPEMVADLKKEMDEVARVADAWILHRESNS